MRKGERGTTVVYADRFMPDDERKRADRDGEAAQAIPFLKRFTVFNVEQCDGLPEDIADGARPRPGPDPAAGRGADPRDRRDFRIGGDRAYYDRRTIMSTCRRRRPISSRSTGTAPRCMSSAMASGRRGRGSDRDLSGTLGSKKYASGGARRRDGVCFSCAQLGIVPTVRHADYIGTWLEVLRDDDRAIVRAASAASKAADYLLAFRTEAGADRRR